MSWNFPRAAEKTSLSAGLTTRALAFGDRRQSVSAEQDAVAVDGRAAAECVGHSVAVGVNRLGRRRIDALDELAEELVGAGAEVVGKSELLDVGAVDEYDLGLDRNLRRADVETLDVRQQVRHPRRRLGDEQRVGGGVGGDCAA